MSFGSLSGRYTKLCKFLSKTMNFSDYFCRHASLFRRSCAILPASTIVLPTVVSERADEYH